MNRYWSLFFIVLLLRMLPGIAQAESSKNSLWPEKIKMGAELRFRHETQLNYNFDSGTSQDNDTFFLTRARVYLDAHPTSRIRLFGMFQDSETFGQSGALVKVKDAHRFYQGYAEFKTDALPLETTLRVGRQEINYGDQRLLGSFGWGNLGRSFDGAVWRFHAQKSWIDFLGLRIEPTTGVENQLAGIYGHWSGFPQGELEPYALYLHGSQSGLNKGELQLATVGMRVKGKFKKNFDYAAEGAYQTGDSSGNTISAFAGHGRIGYTAPVWAKPRFGLEYNFASGDSTPTAGKVTTFNNLFPTNHDKYGFIDFFAWKNLHDFRAGISAAPFSFLKPSIDYHAFFLPETANGVFMASGAQLRAGSASASAFAGQEIDVLIKFEPIKYFDATIGYSLFLPGQFFKDTGSSDPAHFFYSQLTAKY